MKWHIAHRHEIPTAFDALGKDYEAKIINLQKENAELGKRVQLLERELEQAKMDLVKEQAERLKVDAQTVVLNRYIQRAVFGIVARNQILKERLNITMPDPFK